MKTVKTILAAVSVWALSACQHNEDTFLTYANDPMAVHIQAGIASPNTRVNSTGKGDTWDTGDRIFVTNTTSGAVEGKKESHYTYSGSAWTPGAASGYIVWISGVNNSFEAFYPYDEASSTSFTTFTLPANQSSDEPGNVNYMGRADWMLAEEPGMTKPDDATLSLNFEHQLAKVTVKITDYATQYETEKPEFEAPVFTLPTQETGITGKTLDVEAGSTTVTGLLTKDESAAAQHSFTAILLPGKYSASDHFLTLKTGTGETLTVKASHTQLTQTGLEPGKAYTFGLSVGKDALTLGPVTVNDWTAGTPIPGGEAVEEAE